ncbi:helicase associated domain-containing protein [Streptomyces parvus]|uniref:helicase associated domain-containing protein n=1 Tax=Streptomyces parvus TaxID=66428 RepID=UPI003D7372AD
MLPRVSKSGKGSAFERGITALAPFVQREEHLKVPRQHTETILIDGQEHHVKAGVFLSNHKSRRNKLSTEQREQLAALGIYWATAT